MANYIKKYQVKKKYLKWLFLELDIESTKNTFFI